MLTAEAVIDLQALRDNFNLLRQRAPHSRLIAVVKANAYGHGALPLTAALQEADAFAVARLEEAVELRRAGISHPIVLLEGCFCAEDLCLAAELGLETLIHDDAQLQALEQSRLSRPIKVWLKLDTGMHRLGVAPEQVARFVTRLRSCTNVQGEPGFVSHFSRADEPDAPTTAQQLDCFATLTAPYPGPRSLANSAGVLYWPASHFDYVRPGIALYGISPRADRCGRDEGLKPVMTLRSRLIAVREHPAGAPVGYGGDWISPRATRLGVVAMGYGDGYPRTAPSGTPVLVNGRKVPLVGKVSMDMLTVDLGPDASDQPGDPVILWGNGLPAEEVARHIGTIAYELVIKLTPRVAKHYLGLTP